MQVLPKNMAAKKTPYGFVAGVTSLYVSTLCLERSCDISTQAAGSDDYAVKLLNNVTR